MEYLIYVAAGFGVFIYFGIWILAYCVFDDEDPDCCWSDNYSVLECPHLAITDVVEESFANYENVGSYCMDCGKRLSGRTNSC